MDNYWYYTLSAIPQTLAAMIALSATFFVFRLDYISKEIKKSRNDLLRFTILLAPEPQGEIDIIERKTEEDFFEFYKQALERIKPDQSKLGLDNKIYIRLNAEMQRIITSDEWHSRFYSNSTRIANYLYAKRDILKRLIAVKKMMRNRLRWTLSITTLIIVASLSILPNRDVFCNPQLIVGMVLIGSLASVILTTVNVWKIATVRL